MPFILLAALLWTSLNAFAEPINYQVGVILPLKGKNASMGKRALNAITLALPQSRIFIVDSQDDATKSAEAVEHLVQRKNIIAILGGIDSKESEADLLPLNRAMRK